jgi:hypothetical protein
MMWRRFGSNLVVVELAIAVVLLVGAGLLTKSLYRLLHVENGLEPDHLATRRLWHRSHLRKGCSGCCARPACGKPHREPSGVESVGLSNRLPLTGMATPPGSGW